MLRFLSSIVLLAVGTSLYAEEFQPEVDIPQVSLEVRFASVPTSSWEKLGLKPSTLVPPQAEDTPIELDRAEIEPGKQAIQLVSAVAVTESRPPVSYQILSPQQKRQLIQIAHGNSKSNFLQAPKVTVFSGQTTQVLSTTKKPFAVDTNHESDEGVMGIDVNIVEIAEGTILVARADVCEDGSIDLALMFDAVQISDVRTSQVGEATVQVPETRSMKVQLASHLRSEETLAIWYPLNNKKETSNTSRKWFRAPGTTTTAREPAPLVLMVTPRVIEVEDAVSTESK